MTLPNYTVFEVRTTGSDTNGGGFVIGSTGTDYSQQDLAQYSLTNGATNGTATINTTSASSDMVGNIACVSGGTGSIVAVWKQIVSVVVGTSITVDSSAGLTTGTGVHITIGGAMATPGLPYGLVVASGSYWTGVWVKGPATYTLTTATPNVSGGPLSNTSTTTTTNFIAGYQNTRGDIPAVNPVLSWGSVAAPGSNTFMYTCPQFTNAIQNFTMDGNNVAHVCGFNISCNGTGGVSLALNCLAENCSGSGCIGFFSSDYYATGPFPGPYGCKTNNCTIGFQNGDPGRCSAASGGTGFIVQSASDCLAYSNSGVGFQAINTPIFNNCTADSNGSDGFWNNSKGLAAINCISTNNAGYGYRCSDDFMLSGCADYNNGLGRKNSPNGIVFDLNPITLTAAPYPGSGNYQLNNTAGGGALLRGKSWPVYGQPDNRDIGATQHADPAGGLALPTIGSSTVQAIEGLAV